MRTNIDLTAHMMPSEDRAPRNITTDNTGRVYGRGFTGGVASSAVAIANNAEPGTPIVQSGPQGLAMDAAGIPARDQLTPNSAGQFPNPEFGGRAGRIGRLATDMTGPAHVGSVESFALDGRIVKPGRPDLVTTGPVGSSDYGAQYAVAVALSTVDFPPNDLAQLNLALHI